MFSLHIGSLDNSSAAAGAIGGCDSLSSMTSTRETLKPDTDIESSVVPSTVHQVKL